MGRRRKEKERRPHFFKVLLGDFAQQLMLPPKFLKHISEEASKSVILEGPSGGSWPAEIKRSCDGTVLSGGWTKFVEDHSLKAREFLVFRYDGNMHFSIQVFDPTACEREDLFAVQPYKKLKLTNGENKKGKARKHPMDSVHQTAHQETKSGNLELLTGSNGEAKNLQDDNINSVEGSCVTSASPNSKGDGKGENEVEGIPVRSSLETTNEKGKFSGRRPATKEEITRAGEAAKSFTSDFPYVILHMTVTSVYKRYLMRFPIAFSRKHLPREKVEFTLVDPNGKSWRVSYVPGERDQRDRLSVGWGAFAEANNLDEGDFCVFEVTGPTEMRVHIFRVVAETSPGTVEKTKD